MYSSLSVSVPGTINFKGTGRSEGVLFYLQSSEHEFIIRD